MMIYSNFYQTWDVISVLLSKEIKMRYRGTVLGILWSLANPLAFTAVLYIAFRRVLQVNIENYPLFILSALFPWQWLSNSVGSAPMLFISNGALIKRLPFNKAALAVALVLNDMIHFCITIPLFAVFLFISGDHGPSLNWLVGIPLLLVTQNVTDVSDCHGHRDLKRLLARSRPTGSGASPAFVLRHSSAVFSVNGAQKSRMASACQSILSFNDLVACVNDGQ